MRSASRSLLVLLVLLSAGACARPTFPNVTPGKPLAVPYEMFRPDGAGPFPAVVLLHGCEGVSDATRAWARWFRERGYVALVVDSWTPRGLTEACSFTVPDPPNTERLDDALGALRSLQGRPDVDRARIGVIGWSNGGVFALASVNGPTLERAAARGVSVPSPGFAAGIGIYPGGCKSLINDRVVRPVLILMGDADDWTPASQCIEMANAMRARGSDITVETLPGAYHYFDVEGMTKRVLPFVGNANKPGGCCGATVAYDEAAFRTARRRVQEFFDAQLKGRSPR